MASWPSSLPQEWFDVDSAPTMDAADNTIRTSNSAGPAKLRRRFTAQTEDVVLTNKLTQAQLYTLETFVKKTLGEVMCFTWTNPSTGKAVSYRFKAGWSSVKRTHFAGRVWTVVITLEMLP